MNITFTGKIPQTIAPKYTDSSAKKNTVAVLGSSRETDDIMDYMELCSRATKSLVQADRNIVHGCGNNGIMGSAYSAAHNNGKPEQNLAIIMEPMYGDEDLENCIPITTSSSEADRIEKFQKVADNFLIFPGGPSTLQETTTLIAKNYYGKPECRKNIVLVGREFFKGIQDQYQKMYDANLITCPPEKLFTIVDSEDEILEHMGK